MSLSEKEQRVTITLNGASHKIPLLERGCDGCGYLAVKTLSRGLVPTYRGYELEAVEETFYDDTWCDLFDALAHGGPCPECREKRS